MAGKKILMTDFEILKPLSCEEEILKKYDAEIIKAQCKSADEVIKEAEGINKGLLILRKFLYLICLLNLNVL